LEASPQSQSSSLHSPTPSFKSYLEKQTSNINTLLHHGYIHLLPLPNPPWHCHCHGHKFHNFQHLSIARNE
jgi:hypothetical protein